MSRNKWVETGAAFAVGIGVGALFAVLFAPASGEDTRDYISGTLKQGIDEVSATGKRWTRRAQQTVEDVKGSVAAGIDAGEKAYRAAKEA
jgi:gas vesicle protein